MILICRQVREPLAWKPRTPLGGSLTMESRPVGAGPTRPGLSQRDEATTWPPAAPARQGLALGHPGRGGGYSRNPRGSLGGKWKPFQQEGGCGQGGGLEASDQGWDSDAQFPVTRKGGPAGFRTGTPGPRSEPSAGRGRLALSGAPWHP